MYGETVRRARTARGLSQVELARLSGIDQPNISAIENDRRDPTVDTLHRLLLACGFELVASAGSRVVPLPLPDANEQETLLESVDLSGDDHAELTVETRARMLRAALDASEAIVRSR